MSESPSSSIMGSVLKQTQDREGVHIDTPHGWVINDVHHAWTKNETYHWETGNIFHMTSGQVLHVNLNTVEVHATANVLTMHVDITPLNVHIIQSFLGIDVHIEAGHLRKHVNIHGGHHHQLVSNFHQESQAVHIESTKKAQSGWDNAADLLAHGPDADHLGTMNLEADGVMSLRSVASIELESPNAWTVSLKLNDPPGQAILRSTTTTVKGMTEARIAGGLSFANVQTGNISLNNGQQTTVVLNGTTLTTGAQDTHLNGRVHIGNPSIAGMAQQAAVDANTQLIKFLDGATTAALRTQINQLRKKAKLPPLR